MIQVANNEDVMAKPSLGFSLITYLTARMSQPGAQRNKYKRTWDIMQEIHHI